MSWVAEGGNERRSLLRPAKKNSPLVWKMSAKKSRYARKQAENWTSLLHVRGYSYVCNYPTPWIYVCTHFCRSWPPSIRVYIGTHPVCTPRVRCNRGLRTRPPAHRTQRLSIWGRSGIDRRRRSRVRNKAMDKNLKKVGREREKSWACIYL